MVKRTLCMMIALLMTAALLGACSGEEAKDMPTPTLSPMATPGSGGNTEGGTTNMETDKNGDNNPVQQDPGEDTSPQGPNSTAVPDSGGEGDASPTPKPQ